MYPANYDVPSNLAVAASTDYDYLASFSNYGANKVHLAAPGVYVVSTYPGGNHNQFGYMSGTSMATPFVAGLAAMAYREAPNLTGYQMKSLLLSRVTTTAQLNGKVKTSGRVDAQTAMQEAIAQSGTSASQPVYTAVYSQEPSRSVASSGGASGGGGCGMVKALVDQGAESMNDPWKITLFFSLLMIPILVWFVMMHFTPINQRRFDRYKLESQLSLKVGDREIQGTMKTISLGGLSFSADDILERGGVVKIQLQAPDGQSVYEVEGQIVWSDNTQKYGIKFVEAEEGLLQSIKRWSKNAVKV
jgi:hypothetical protein